MFAAAGIGFGGRPWEAFAVGASLIVLLGIPQQLEDLKRYRRQPKADVILGMIFRVVLAIVGAFASAWAGYGLRYVLAQLLHR
jgi:hypothetical protein